MNGKRGRPSIKKEDLLNNKLFGSKILKIYDRTRIFYNFDLGRFQRLALKPIKFNYLSLPATSIIQKLGKKFGDMRFRHAFKELYWDELSTEQLLPFLPTNKAEDGGPIRSKYRELRAIGQNQREAVVEAFLFYFGNSAEKKRRKRSKTEPWLNILFSSKDNK